MNKYLVCLIILIIILILIFFSFLVKEEELIIFPMYGKDSDGTPSEEIIKNIKERYEIIILKTYPYGYLEVWGWDKISFIKKVYLEVEWKTYEDLGAGNIYIGYTFDRINYFEIGPFNESKEYKKMIIEIPSNFYNYLDKLVVRFRGEDLDYGIDAIAEVKIYLKVIRYKFRL